MKTKTILTVLGIYLIACSSQAQDTIQIGTGGEQNVLPVYATFNYAWTDHIYLQNEIAEAGIITEIALKSLSYDLEPTTDFITNNQRIFFKHTAESSFADGTYPDTLTMEQSFTGDITWPLTAGETWHYIKLDTPFYYNNIDNLEILYENRDGSGDTYEKIPFFRLTDLHPICRAKYMEGNVEFPGDGKLFEKRTNIKLVIEVIDAGVTKIDSPASPFTVGNKDIEISFKNFGLVTLDSLDIEWEINEIPQTTYKWLGNLAPGDSICNILLGNNYFTYGVDTIKAWTANPNGYLDIFNTNDTIENLVTACYPMSGTYIIGEPPPNFLTFADAVDSLKNSCGIEGPVVFNVKDGTYNEQISIDEIPGTSDNNTITFQSASGDSSTVTLVNSSPGYTLQLNGADHVIFKSITIAKENTSDNIVEITNNADNNSFENCRFTGSGTTETLLNDGGTNDNNNTILNSRFEGGNTAISLKGNATNGYEENIQITGNRLIGQKTTGIYCSELEALTINSNSISSNSAITGIGINTQKEFGSYSITKNSITINNEGKGIHVYLGGSGGPPINDTCLIANNFIHSEKYGLYIDPYGVEAKIYNNNINITGTNPESYALRIEYNDDESYFDMKNNIFCNMGNGLAYYEYGNTIDRDYNNYFSNGEHVGYSYSYWTVPPGEEHSMSVIPVFNSDSNLHVSNPALNGAGIVLEEITEDYDGEPRDMVTPDIGADEFVPCSSPLNGNYTIGGASPDFESFTEAVNRLISCGVNGAVTFNVTAGIYTEQIIIPEISGASVTNTITFQSETGDSSDVTLQYSSLNKTHNYTVKLDSVDFITFKNLTLSATGSTYARVIEIANGASNNQFLNNHFTGSADGWTTDDPRALIYSAASTDTNNIFISNLFSNGSSGVLLCGENSTTLETGTQIINNIFQDQYRYGIYLKNQYLSTVKNNKVLQTTPGTYRYGIYITNSSGSTDSSGYITNNFVNLNITNNGYGISTGNSEYQKIYFNTINITGNSTDSRAINIKGNNVELINNIIVNQANGYAMYCSDSTGINSDFNNLYSNGVRFINSNGSNINNLESWKNSSPHDSNSISRLPVFVSETDLHIDDPNMNGMGTPLAEVTTDIDGENRDSEHPDLGADELTGLNPLAGTYAIGPSSPDFLNFNEAVDSLNQVGVSGPVTFNVETGTYNEQVAISMIPRSSEDNTITFQSASGDSSKVILEYVSNSSENYTIKLDSCRFITIRDITVKALNTDYARVIEFTNGASDNILSHNVFEGGGTQHATIFSLNSQDNNNLIKNNLILNGKLGIQMIGESDAEKESGTQIISNVFNGQINQPILLKYQDAPLVMNNSIMHNELNEQDWVGIQIENSSGLADSLGLIANNVIHINTNVTASGFWVKNSTYQRIYFNSIHITGNAEDSRCIYHEGGSGKNIYLKNNIFSNIASGLSIVTYNHPGLDSDYNDLYTDGNRFINVNGTTSVDNLANWQSGYNQDLHSYSVDPKFVSDTDLHANNIHLDGSGLPLTEVTVDFEDDQRDLANPDIGADEFDGCSMSEIYTIGPSGADYTSFEIAVEALSNCRVTGPVFFDVQSGTYNEQIVIPEIIDASETNTITFRSASGDSTDVTLTYESVSQDTNYTVKLNGADYLKFENLTIQATGNDYAKVIGITNGATNNRFSNNKFTGVNTTDGSEANGALVYSPDGSALKDTCNIFSENLFQSGSHGIVLRGGSSYIENGNQITGNCFEDQVSYGIYLYDQKNALISQNHISNSLSENDYYGIYVSGESIIINKNEIDINNVNSNVRGIYVTNISSSLYNLISNNFVHIHSTGTGHVAGTEPGNYCLVYYNSINITGDRTGSYAANLQSGYNNIFKNNIFLNNAGGYAIGDYYGISINNTSDYNNIYSNGEYLGVYNYSNLANLQEWTATTLLDSNSISIDPEFISDSDLHTINKNLKAGIPLPDVDDDIDGETRDATTPFIGADEYLFTPGSENDILSFSFAKQTGPATIDAINHTVDIEVIYGTDVTGLVATFTVSDWATIAIGATSQESGVTSNDFTSPVTYTVTAEDGTQQDWIVTVTVATTQSNENDILTYSFAEQTGAATINAVNHTVDIEVAYGTNVTTLVATFTISDWATIAIGATSQESGITSNDFTSPVTYTVTAEDGTQQDWIVTVTIAAAPSSENDILTFSFAEQTGAATIDAVNHTVDIEVAYGTNVTTLVATFTISDLATIVIGATSQESGITSNDFTSPVTYTVTAEDGTQQDWVVTVTIAAAPSSENDILTFSFAEQTGAATIDAVNHTVDIEVAYGTNVTTLVATFTISDWATIAIGATSQESGITSNDFTSPVTYTVTAEDGTQQNWIVTLTIAAAPSSENDILTFSFAEQTGAATIDAVNHTVDIEVAYGTNVTTLVATFTISDLATITIGSTSQESGVTSNDFTNPVTYTIIAENGTPQDWVITVTEEIIVISTFPYLEDFEDGKGGWYEQGTNSSWQLGTPAGSTINSAGSGSKSWVTNLTGDYNANDTSFVYSPTFDFTNLTDAAIAMKIWWDSEGMYDGTCFQYSINDGASWQSVGNYNDLENWYNTSNIEALYSGVGTSAGWSGDGTYGQGSNGWITARHKLNEFDGNSSVKFRFAFASNDSYEQDGFAFDSIKIYSDATINVPINTPDGNLIRVFPNPNKGIFYIYARFEKGTRIRFDLVNPQGQIVFNLETKTGKKFREELNVSHLPAGVYYLKMTNKEVVIVKKIVIE